MQAVQKTQLLAKRLAHFSQNSSLEISLCHQGMLEQADQWKAINEQQLSGAAEELAELAKCLERNAHDSAQGRATRRQYIAQFLRAVAEPLRQAYQFVAALEKDAKRAGFTSDQESERYQYSNLTEQRDRYQPPARDLATDISHTRDFLATMTSDFNTLSQLIHKENQLGPAQRSA